MVGSLTDPIICHKGQEEIPPEWLQSAITIERLVMNMAVLKGERPTGIDADVAWYLSIASLEFPFVSHVGFTSMLLSVFMDDIGRRK